MTKSGILTPDGDQIQMSDLEYIGLDRLNPKRGCGQSDSACEGRSHSIYWNPATSRREPVPRHNEVPSHFCISSLWLYSR